MQVQVSICYLSVMTAMYNLSNSLQAMKSSLFLNQHLSNSREALSKHMMCCTCCKCLIRKISLAEEKSFGLSLLQTSRKYNIRNSWKHAGKGGKDKKTAEGKDLKQRDSLRKHGNVTQANVFGHIFRVK